MHSEQTLTWLRLLRQAPELSVIMSCELPYEEVLAVVRAEQSISTMLIATNDVP